MQTYQPTVLLVADEPLLCEFILDLLRPRGYFVTVADPDSSVARLAAGDVDLVLLDLGWPESNGIDLSLRLRAAQRGASVPIIALTELPPEHRDVVGFSVGPDAYLTKPFDIDDLLARLHQLL
jgi:DNA-binding response OmpR family regulator